MHTASQIISVRKLSLLSESMVTTRSRIKAQAANSDTSWSSSERLIRPNVKREDLHTNTANTAIKTVHVMTTPKQIAKKPKKSVKREPLQPYPEQENSKPNAKQEFNGEDADADDRTPLLKRIM